MRFTSIVVLFGFISLTSGCSPGDRKADDTRYHRQLDVFKRDYVEEELRAEALRKLAFDFASRDGVAQLIIDTAQDKTEQDLVRAKAFLYLKNFQAQHPEVFELLIEAAADKTEPIQVRASALIELATNFMSKRPSVPGFFLRIARDRTEPPDIRSKAIHHLAWKCREPPSGYFELLMHVVKGMTEPVQVRDVAAFCLAVKYPEEPEVIAWAEDAAKDSTEQKTVRSHAEMLLHARQVIEAEQGSGGNG